MRTRARKWVTGVCTKAWQEDCRELEVLSAEGQVGKHLKDESNSEERQQCQATEE